MTQTNAGIGGGNPAPLDLLFVCALLQWFDRDLLEALAECGEDDIGALLASDLVEPEPGRAGRYRLQEEARTSALARLRTLARVFAVSIGRAHVFHNLFGAGSSRLVALGHTVPHRQGGHARS